MGTIGKDLSTLPSEISRRPATYVIAASNSRFPIQADYICDGVDDNVEIQAAIDATPNGGSFLLLEGIYYTSRPILYQGERQRIHWQTAGRVEIRYSGSDAALRLDGGLVGNGVENCRFGDMYFNMLAPVTAQAAVEVNIGSSANVFEGLTIEGPDTNGAGNALTAALADDGGVFTNQTTAAGDMTLHDMSLLPVAPAVNDAYYFGYSTSFRQLMLYVSTAGAGTWTITWEYWNGSAWTATTNTRDSSSGFTIFGIQTVSYDFPSDWASTTVNGISAFWLRARVSSFTAITTRPLGAKAVVNLLETIGIHIIGGSSGNILGAIADDGGVLTDQTTAANSAGANDMTLLPAIPVVNDAYYFGNWSRNRTLTLNVGQAGAGTWTLTWEYWNGTTWAALSNVTDNTNSFRTAGSNVISWTVPSDWTKRSVSTIYGYWVRTRVSSFTSITTQPLGTQASVLVSGTYLNEFHNLKIHRLATGILIESANIADLRTNGNMLNTARIFFCGLGIKVEAGSITSLHNLDVESNTFNLHLNRAINTTSLSSWWADTGHPAGSGHYAIGPTNMLRWFVLGGTGMPLQVDYNQPSTNIYPNLHMLGSASQNFLTLTRLAWDTGSFYDNLTDGDMQREPNVNIPVFSRNADFLPMGISDYLRGRELVFTTEGWTEAAINGGSFTKAPNAMLLSAIGAINRGYSLVSPAYGLQGRSGAQNFAIDWTKKLMIFFTLLRDEGINNEPISYIHFKNANTTQVDLDAIGIGLKVTNNGSQIVLTGESYGASGRATIALSNGYLPAGIGHQIDVSIEWSPGVPRIDWVVQGLNAGTQTTAANMPAILGANSYVMISHQNGASGTASVLRVQGLRIWQDSLVN